MKDRRAVRAAHAKLVTATERWAKDMESATKRKADLNVLRQAIELYYREVADVDVSDCPDDYRAQYRRFVINLRELSEAAKALPDNGWEAFGQAITGSDSVEKFKTRLDNISLEVGELDAIAKKY